MDSHQKHGSPFCMYSVVLVRPPGKVLDNGASVTGPVHLDAAGQ